MSEHPGAGPYRPTDEKAKQRAELAIAFFEGKITRPQAIAVLRQAGVKISGDNNIDTRMAMFLGTGVRRGLVHARMIQ